MRSWCCVALACVVLGASATAHAADERDRSREAFRRGVALAQQNDYAAAKSAFLEAYKLFPHPSILLNLGIARTRTGEYVEAEQDLVRFLADDGGAPADEIASARTTLNEARSHLGTFRLRVATGGARATLDERPVALLPGQFVDVRTKLGTHVLHVEAEEHEPVEREIRVDATKTVDVDLTLRARPKKERPQVVGNGQRVAGWALVSSAVVMAGFTVFAALRANSLSSDYSLRGNPGFQDPDVRREGVTFRTLADLAGITTVGLATVGIYLLFTAPSSKPASARLFVGPGFASGTF